MTGQTLRPEPVGDPSSCQVIWRKLDPDTIARQDSDEVHPQLPGNMRENFVTIVQLNAKHRVRQWLGHFALNFDNVLLWHRLPSITCK